MACPIPIHPPPAREERRSHYIALKTTPARTLPASTTRPTGWKEWCRQSRTGAPPGRV